MKWVRAIAAFIAALVVGLFWIVAHDSNAFVGDDSPERLVDAWRPREFAELKILPIALPAPAGESPRLCPAMG